jgi:hypothetical protein
MDFFGDLLGFLGDLLVEVLLSEIPIWLSKERVKAR